MNMDAFWDSSTFELKCPPHLMVKCWHKFYTHPETYHRAQLRLWYAGVVAESIDGYAYEIAVPTLATYEPNAGQTQGYWPNSEFLPDNDFGDGQGIGYSTAVGQWIRAIEDHNPLPYSLKEWISFDVYDWENLSSVRVTALVFQLCVAMCWAQALGIETLRYGEQR